MPSTNIVGYKRKRSSKRSRPKRSKRSILPQSISAVQRQIVSTCVGATAVFPVGSTGFFPPNGSATDLSGNGLSMAFSLTGAYASVGSIAGGLKQDSVLMGTAYSNISQFRGVYDQYRIRKIELDFYYNINSAATSGSVGIPSLPLIYTVIDYDDQGFLVNPSDALSYSSCKVMQLGNSGGAKQRIVLSKPTIRVGAGTVAATSTGETNVLSMLKSSPWLSTDAATIEHAGVKLYIDTQNLLAGGAVTSAILNVVVRCYVDFKYSK